MKAKQHVTTTHLKPLRDKAAGFTAASVTFYDRLTWMESLWLKMRKQYSPLCTFTTVSAIFEVHRKIDHADLQNHSTRNRKSETTLWLCCKDSPQEQL